MKKITKITNAILIMSLSIGLLCSCSSSITNTIEEAKEDISKSIDDASEYFYSSDAENSEDLDTSDVTEDVSGVDSSFDENASDSGNSVLVIEIKSVDGGEKNYSFTYNGEEFSAIYTTDHWKIIDSYKITSESDMEVICQALIDVHPVHGADMESYRTADDMAYEWLQHNLAYEVLPEDSEWRKKAKDVDFNPEDQGKSFIEIYEQRTGKQFDFSVLYGG